MKWIDYDRCTRVNHGTEEKPAWKNILTHIRMGWNETNEEIAKHEAWGGEYTIEDDGMESVAEPTQLDQIEAQVTYTAMMTDTLLEV